MTDQLPVYSVVVSREDDLWVAVVDDLPGGATDVERFRELPDAVRDLIATLRGVEPDTFWIEWHYRQGDLDLTQVIANLHQWEQLADRAARYRDSARMVVVERLRAAGLSYREIADVIEVSHQRVGQLLEKNDKVDISVELSDVAASLHVRWPDELFARPDPAAGASPFEALLVALLHSASKASPKARSELLSNTAALLTETATDQDFLRSAG
ncbi:transcriptional regulator with XRE-family HTH domain [Actinokineospora baliensis]|uniref:hypothetical protein n=1 Tax=Actinokineospora baliensis TaxID=547056 RepID=UPI00195C4D55|nr:hypothetical protein [Actinokineospora baliensis]MBM7772273.1 transcriptional regulator with XRE-family HTH domain [Actinokineospora baliensis]